MHRATSTVQRAPLMYSQVSTINMLEKLTVDQIQSFTSAFHEESGIRIDLDLAEELLRACGLEVEEVEEVKKQLDDGSSYFSHGQFIGVMLSRIGSGKRIPWSRMLTLYNAEFYKRCWLDPECIWEVSERCGQTFSNAHKLVLIQHFSPTLSLGDFLKYMEMRLEDPEVNGKALEEEKEFDAKNSCPMNMNDWMLKCVHLWRTIWFSFCIQQSLFIFQIFENMVIDCSRGISYRNSQKFQC